MSEAHGSDSRKRRKGGKLFRTAWVWAPVGVLVLLLIVNLVMTLPALIRGETPEGFLAAFLSPENLRRLGLWGGLIPGAAAAVLGVRWAHDAYGRSRRSSALWLRRGFIVASTSWIALLVVIMDIDAFPDRTPVAIAAAGLFSLTVVPFAMAARAASQSRAGGGSGESRRRRKRSSSSDEGDRGDAA